MFKTRTNVKDLSVVLFRMLGNRLLLVVICVFIAKTVATEEDDKSKWKEDLYSSIRQ